MGSVVPPFGSAVTINFVTEFSSLKYPTLWGFGPTRANQTGLPQDKPQSWYVSQVGKSRREDHSKITEGGP